MVIEDFGTLIDSYVEGTQGIGEFRATEVRYHMCGIEGETVTVKGQNINTFEEFEFRFVKADIMLWYVNKRIELLGVSIHG
ncbi:hypothetical protein VPHK356_0091 [Vibrio phage K356]|nr:hypothetical protein MYOV002v2_p0085 [Vibrio phage 144E46.1]